MIRKLRYDRERLKALVRYVVGRASTASDLAELGKALWLAEARNFVLHRTPISGATYRRKPLGPAARGIRTVLSEIASADDIDGLPALADDERDSIEWALRHLHDPECEAIWAKAAIGEVIPYHALLALRMRQPNADEIAWAKLRAGEPAAK